MIRGIQNMIYLVEGIEHTKKQEGQKEQEGQKIERIAIKIIYNCLY